jgi:hypothetical protein
MEQTARSPQRPRSADSVAHAGAVGGPSAEPVPQQRHQPPPRGASYKQWQRLTPPESDATTARPATGRLSWPQSISAPAQRTAPAHANALTTRQAASRSKSRTPWHRSALLQHQRDAGPTAVEHAQAGMKGRAADHNHAAGEAQRAEALQAEHLEVARQVLQLDADLRNAQVIGH